MRLIRLLAFHLILLASVISTHAFELFWPTEDNSFFKGANEEDFIQPTVSGKVISGTFGYVRNDGQKFHEGIDIKPIKRDKKYEAIDQIKAVMDGKVVHINTKAGNSSYGRYIVIEHFTKPAIYSLYAHLKCVDRNIKKGCNVKGGQIIGIMGRSSNDGSIPKNRAHLHFEMGVMLSTHFQKWYDNQKYGSKNLQGCWNGLNLIGYDPLDFYKKCRSAEIKSIDSYFNALSPAFTIRVLKPKVPNYIERYPTLLTKPIDRSALIGWDIDFTWFRLPFRWTPLHNNDRIKEEFGKAELIAYHPQRVQELCKRDTIIIKEGQLPKQGKALAKIISLLFDY